MSREPEETQDTGPSTGSTSDDDLCSDGEFYGPEHCGNDCGGTYNEYSGDYDEPVECEHCGCCSCTSCFYARYA